MSLPVGGIIVSASSSMENAFAVIQAYLSSENALNAENTQLEQSLSNAEANCSTAFEQQMNTPNSNAPNTDYIHMLATGTYDNGKALSSTDIQQITTEYTDANSQNQSMLKIYDGQNQMVQGLLSQFAQTQTSIVQMMSMLNQVGSNLIHLIGA